MRVTNVSDANTHASGTEESFSRYCIVCKRMRRGKTYDEATREVGENEGNKQILSRFSKARRGRDARGNLLRAQDDCSLKPESVGKWSTRTLYDHYYRFRRGGRLVSVIRIELRISHCREKKNIIIVLTYDTLSTIRDGSADIERQ